MNNKKLIAIFGFGFILQSHGDGLISACLAGLRSRFFGDSVNASVALEAPVKNLALENADKKKLERMGFWDAKNEKTVKKVEASVDEFLAKATDGELIQFFGKLPSKRPTDLIDALPIDPVFKTSADVATIAGVHSDRSTMHVTANADGTASATWAAGYYDGGPVYSYGIPSGMEEGEILPLGTPNTYVQLRSIRDAGSSTETRTYKIFKLTSKMNFEKIAKDLQAKTANELRSNSKEQIFEDIQLLRKIPGIRDSATWDSNYSKQIAEKEITFDELYQAQLTIAFRSGAKGSSYRSADPSVFVRKNASGQYTVQTHSHSDTNTIAANGGAIEYIRKNFGDNFHIDAVNVISTRHNEGATAYSDILEFEASPR